jgi:dodecin
MSVYRVIEVVGRSTTSWEEAAADAIKTAGQSIMDLRVAESSSRTSTSGTAVSSSTAPKSGCRSNTSRDCRAPSGALIAWAPSVVIIANTEANRVCVVAQG